MIETVNISIRSKFVLPSASFIESISAIPNAMHNATKHIIAKVCSTVKKNKINCDNLVNIIPQNNL